MPSQAYVALSRAVSLSSCRITNFQPSKVRAHPSVAHFYRQVQAGRAGAIPTQAAPSSMHLPGHRFISIDKTLLNTSINSGGVVGSGSQLGREIVTGNSNGANGGSVRPVVSQGFCYQCGASGHSADRCPKAKRVKLSQSPTAPKTACVKTGSLTKEQKDFVESKRLAALAKKNAKMASTPGLAQN